MLSLPDDDRRSRRLTFFGLAIYLALIFGVFFLGLFLVSNNKSLGKFIKAPTVDARSQTYEVFGFAPFWTLSKVDNIDWNTLTTFAYFSLPVLYDGSIDRYSYEWTVFEGKKLEGLFDRAKENGVRRVVTLTQMEAANIEAFLENPDAWETTAHETSAILKERGLEGVNVDLEYMKRNDALKKSFSDFMDTFTRIVKNEVPDAYITVSVPASSARFNKIYDIGHLASTVDGIFVMAYDFYYPGSDAVGPSAPLYGFNEGKGPFWYDVSTAIEDFLKVAEPKKIIMGVPYYAWNYPSLGPSPKNERSQGRATATSVEKMVNNPLLSTTPMGGWDSQAQVSWRAYWDDNGWHVFYMEDAKSLGIKYDFAKSKKLAGVGMWALGFDNDESLWKVLANKFSSGPYLSSNNKETREN